MAHFSRRRFLGVSAGLAATWGLSPQLMGRALAAPETPADVPTTLLQTFRQSSTPVTGQYRTLLSGPGETYTPRFDLIGKKANNARVNQRRSLAYLGHMSDIHIIDPQSPARLEPMQQMSPTLWQGAARPQDTMTVQVQAQMVAAMAAARYSPLTGSPMAAMFNTGDSTDMISQAELRWYVDIMDGKSVVPNTGIESQYDGPQAWPEADYAYHPDDPSIDRFGPYGFPSIPGVLKAAVSQSVESPGMPVPWYAVYGNHDAIYYGTFPIDAALQSLAVGERKPAVLEALASNYFGGWASDPTVLGRLQHMITTQFGNQPDMRSVASDPERELFSQLGFMEAHFATETNPGPVGHGFTRENLESGKTYWQADVGSHLRLFGLDTCNQVTGADGAVPQDQFEWLQEELAKARDLNKMAIVLSHHNSFTLENGAESVTGPHQPLIHAEQFIDMLLQFPNMIAWCNGHTHINTINAHPRTDGTGGFWEITTASCIDFPQQQQLVEILDNKDGTISIFTTVLDHLSAAEWSAGDFSQQGLASLSRQLSANDWVASPLKRLGSPLDRNTELLLPAPFDLSVINDADLATEIAVRKARIVAYEEAQK